MVMYTEDLLHVSESNTLNLLIPRLPTYLKTKEAQNANFEDLSISRVCFAPTIEGCLLGIDIPRYKFKGKEFLKYFVYEGIYVKKQNIITNKELIEKELVYDAHITGEVWVTSPVSVKLKYEIRVFPYGDNPKEIEYTPLRLKISNKKYLGKNGKLIALLPNYEIVKTF